MALESLEDFMKIWMGRPVDFDGVYPNQCVDLVQLFNRDAVGAPPLIGNASDIWNTYPQAFYRRVPNDPLNIPSPGSVIIWGQNATVGTGIYGHIAIFVHGDAHTFVSCDVNWPEGSNCHLQNHSYDGVIGWLVPLRNVSEAPPKPAPQPAPAALGADDYAAATWVSALQKMTAGVPVAQCAARKAEVETWLKAHP